MYKNDAKKFGIVQKILRAMLLISFSLFIAGVKGVIPSLGVKELEPIPLVMYKQEYRL